MALGPLGATAHIATTKAPTTVEAMERGKNDRDGYQWPPGQNGKNTFNIPKPGCNLLPFTERNACHRGADNIGRR